ncbi:MAG: porin family protein [Bacteroidota bacterium]
MMKWSLLLMIFYSGFAFGQHPKPKNYSRFDERRAHFGFMLGLNSAGFSVYQNADSYKLYGVKDVVSKSQTGGQLGIVSTLKLWGPTTRLRFLPSLSFQERVLNYTSASILNPLKDSTLEERIASTNLDFPLMFQFRTTRFNNFATYVLAGVQYSLDLQSQQNANQSFSDPFIKIKRDDFQVQIGGGVEFFTPYFKFGIELKYSQGFVNSLIQDNTSSSKPIDFLYNRVWGLAIIFEG